MSRDAASFINDDFIAALDVFYTCENLGSLPFAGGWADQPLWITQALSILKVERWKVDEEELELKKREKEDQRKHVR